MPDRFHQTLQIAGHAMPGAWAHLLPEDAQWLRLPRERFAACGTCPPAAMGELTSACRCCGYLPQMTNFALGLALQSDSADAVRGVIAAGHALPFGLLPSPRVFADAIATNAAGRFGMEPELACPFKHPETHQCGVYAYRNSICSTFFCAHDHGEAGEEVWDLLQGVAGTAESAVAQWAMGEQGLPAREVCEAMDSLAPRVAGWVGGESRWPDEALDALWGDFRGREEAFFVACADAVVEARAELPAIASRWIQRDAAAYDQALKDALPPASQEAFPQIADGSVERMPLDEIWYQLQVAERNLVQIPFGERVALAPGLTVEGAPSTDRLPILIGGARRRLELPDPEGPRSLYPTPAECDALALFEAPRRLDEKLLATAEMEALDDPRGFLAEQLRHGVLVPA